MRFAWQKKNKYRKKLQAAELLLLPACFNRSQAEQLTLPPGVVGDDHWYLLALKRVSSEPVRFDITIVDGFNRCPSQNYHFLWQQALLLLKCLYGPNVKYTEVLQTLPQQSNVYDCGAVVGYCAQQMLNQDNVCLTLPQQIDYSAHRLVMAQTLAPEFKLPQLLSYSPQNLTSEPQTPSLTTSPRVTA